MDEPRLYYIATCYVNGRPTGKFETFLNETDANFNFKGEGKEIGMATLEQAEIALDDLTYVDKDTKTLEWK